MLLSVLQLWRVVKPSLAAADRQGTYQVGNAQGVAETLRSHSKVPLAVSL